MNTATLSAVLVSLLSQCAFHWEFIVPVGKTTLDSCKPCDLEALPSVPCPDVKCSEIVAESPPLVSWTVVIAGGVVTALVGYISCLRRRLRNVDRLFRGPPGGAAATMDVETGAWASLASRRRGGAR